MATAEELRGIIHRPLAEVSQAMVFAMGMFNKQQADADKEVGREMSNLSKRYVSVLQAITGVKDGWVTSPTPHLLSIDNEDAGITIDIHWETDLGSGKADVTVELNKRSGPEGPGAKWKSKFHIVKGVTPNQMGLSPTSIIADQAVRKFLKEHAEELLAPLVEEGGWTTLTEAAMDRKKLERAIYKAMPIGNKGSYKTVGSKTVKAPAKSGGQPTIMFTGDLARKMGRKDYDSATLASLSDDEIQKIASILGVTEDVEMGVEMNEVETLRSIIERKGSPYTKGGTASEVEFAKQDKKQGWYGGSEDLKRRRKEAARSERHSKKREIAAQMRGEEMEGFVDEGHGVVFLSTAIDATFTVEADVQGMSAAERFQGNLLDLSAYKDKRFLSPSKMMMFGKLVSKRMANTFDPIYVADPQGMLKDAAIMAPFRAEMDRVLGMGTWNIDKVKSPKTGKSGWRITYSKGGSEVVPGGDMRTAQIAFDKLKKALRNFELPTEGGSRRKADPGEFMLMNMAQNGTKAMFKHRDTRNYIIIDMKSGKMDVPITSKAFFRGYFDVFEDVDLDELEGLDESGLADVFGDPRKLSRLMGGSPEQRAVTASDPKFRAAMKKLTGKADPSYNDILKALMAYGIDRATAGQYALFATERFTEETELDEGVAKHEVKRAHDAWKDAEASANSMEKWQDEGWREARVEAEKLKKDYETLAAKWEKQSKKAREYSRGRADAMRSVGMVRTRSGQWEDDDISNLRSIIEYKGTAVTHGKQHGSAEADLWGSEHGEKKQVGGRRSGHSTTAKKMAHKAERQVAKQDIQSRLRGEDVSLDDLGHYLELVAEELQEAMAGEPVEPVLPVQMANLKTIQSTADQLSRFTREFADYLKKAMAAKAVDVERLGRFGRQVDAAHNIFKNTYRKLALGYSESIGEGAEGGWEINLLEVSLQGFRIPSPKDVTRKWLSDAVNVLVNQLDQGLVYGGGGATVRPYGEGYMISGHKPDWVATIEPLQGKKGTHPSLKFWMGFDWNTRKPDVTELTMFAKPADAAKSFAKNVNAFVKKYN